MVSIQIRLLPDEAARVMRAIELGADHGSLADGAVALAETMLSGSSVAHTRTASPGAGARAGSSGANTGADSSGVNTGSGSSGVNTGSGSSGANTGTGSSDPNAGAGESSSEPPNGEVRPSRMPIRSPVEVVVHISAANLEGTTDVGDGLSAEMCRRLLCDAGVELVFLDPDGREIPPIGQRSPLPDGSFDRLRAQIQQHGIAISAETNAPGWDGQPVDYDACVNSIGGWDPM
jgi:hypothetical protein